MKPTSITAPDITAEIRRLSTVLTLPGHDRTVEAGRYRGHEHDTPLAP
jgi:hypothetical protein